MFFSQLMKSLEKKANHYLIDGLFLITGLKQIDEALKA
jgi:hypothetical protein